MAVQIHAHTGPVQPRRHLLDVGRFTGAVQALHQHAPVMRETRQQRQRDLGVEAVHAVDLRHMGISLAESRYPQIGVYAEHLAHGHHAVGQARLSGLGGLGGRNGAQSGGPGVGLIQLSALRGIGRGLQFNVAERLCRPLQAGQHGQHLVGGQPHDRRLHGYAQVGAAGAGGHQHRSAQQAR